MIADTGFPSPALGVWCKTPSGAIAEVLASAGVDYLCADQQHGLVDDAALVSLAQAAAAWGCRLLTRVATDDPAAIQRAIDIGVNGVLVPGVNDADAARRVAGFFDYPPAGHRSFGSTRALLAGDGPTPMASTRPLFLPMVETTAAVENIDSVLSTPGVDGVYVGPVDLSISFGLGAGRHTDEPRVAAAMTAVTAACKRHGKLLATGVADADAIVSTVESGFDFVTVGSDWAILQATLRTRVSSARSALRSRGPAGGDAPVAP